MMAYTESDPEGQLLLHTFAEALEGFGWKANRNLISEYRWAGGDTDLMQSQRIQPDYCKTDLQHPRQIPIHAGPLLGVKRTSVLQKLLLCLNIEYVQNRALGCGGASTFGNRFCQQPFQLT
jgi:hypothetical protein